MRTSSARRGTVSRTALTLLTGTFADLADTLDVSPDLVRSWSQGRRTPTPTTAKQLAVLCERRVKALTKAAQALRGSIEEGGAR